MLGELSGGIAHQLSTPLQLIATNLHFLQRSWPAFDTRAPANDNAGSTNHDLAFLAEEVPKALAQSLESLESMALLLRTMKEWCAPQDGTTQVVDPVSTLRRVLLLTQHRWRYACHVAQHSEGLLPTLHCCAQDLAATLTELMLVVSDLHAAHAEDQQATVDVACRGVDDQIELTWSWHGVAPAPDAEAIRSLRQLAARLHALVVVDAPDPTRVTLRLRVPCSPPAQDRSVSQRY